MTGTAHAGPAYVDASGAPIDRPATNALSKGGHSPGPPWIRLGLSGGVLILLAAAVAWSTVLLRRA